MPLAGVAQIAPDNRAALLDAGFSAAELKATETTQIGSNYPLYEAWQRCAREAGDITLMNGLAAAAATSFSDGGCEDEALRLRAGLARTLGLARATRTIALLRADFVLTMQRRWKAQHPSMPAGTVQVGAWSIKRAANGACMAFQAFNGQIGTLGLIGGKGKVIVLLQTDYPQPADGAVSPNRVIIGHHPTPSVMEGQFRVVRIAGHTWLSNEVSAQDLVYLHQGGSMLIEDTRSSGARETRSGDPTFGAALNAVQHC